MRFRDAVAAEFERRRARNARYSLRRFARTIGIHHSTVSRMMRGSHRVPSQTIAAIAHRLGMSRTEINEFVIREDEAAVLQAIARPAFRPDCRWLATIAGISVDRVNIVLHTLLRAGALRMPATNHWELSERMSNSRPAVANRDARSRIGHPRSELLLFGEGISSPPEHVTCRQLRCPRLTRSER
jgi:transcriptional regulator with XRE-family HTH domain